jgi:Flp pilus assembly secretin CpaC
MPGVVRILAEPTLTAISGEAAHFVAGGKFPINLEIDPDKTSIETSSRILLDVDYFIVYRVVRWFNA